MATVRVETDQDDQELYLYEVFVNDELIGSGDNFTSEEYARSFAQVDIEEWRQRTFPATLTV